MEFSELIKNMNKKAEEERVTRKMLSVIREETEKKMTNGYPITKKDEQFSDVREAQEQNILKTLGENVEFDENALVYYKDNNDLVLTGRINSLNTAFQFRYNDPSGEGCYIWSNALQLTDANNRTIGKIRDAFVNWKTSLIQDGDLMQRLKEMAEN